MYHFPTTRRCIPQRLPSGHLFKSWLLVITSLMGCFSTTQATKDTDAIAHSQMRPMNLDVAKVEQIGRSALEKIGYEGIVRLAEKAGYVEYKSNVTIQFVNYESAAATNFVPVFSRYAVAAAVASQADTPLPGPADVAAIGIIVVGLIDAGLLDGYVFDTFGGLLFSKARTEVPAQGGPRPSPKFEAPTNPPQLPPTDIPPGWRIREMPATEQYPNGYWKLEKPMQDGSWQPINPSTMKPGNRPQTHVEFPPRESE